MFFLYNPYAGKGQIKSQLSDVLDIFTKAGYEVTVRPTQAPRDAWDQVKKCEDYDLIVCAGGDGTLDEVVTGMFHRDDGYIPIGYLPEGSTNDFGTSLGLPGKLKKAAKVAVNGVPFPCDIGRFNDSHVFVYVAAFGLFTDVSYETDQDMKNVLGHAAYVLEGMKRLNNVESIHMKITYDGEVMEDDFLVGTITNSRSVGGFKNLVNKYDVVFDDGLFEVTLVKMPQNVLQIPEIINALLFEQFNSDYMVTLQASHIVFESDKPIAWTMDGEDGGVHERVEIHNDRKAVEIMLPEEMISEVSLASRLDENGNRINRGEENSDVYDPYVHSEYDPNESTGYVIDPYMESTMGADVGYAMGSAWNTEDLK